MYHQFKLAAAVLILMSAVSSCSKTDNPATPSGSTDSSDHPLTTSILLARDAKLGTYLTDSLGKTLYFFALDANGNSGCVEGCTISWPVFYREHLTVTPQLETSDFGTIVRPDGAKQTTYKGWPLYYYQADTKAGFINGDASRGTWFVAKPDYTVMLANYQLTGDDGVDYNSQLQPGTEVTQYLTDDRGRTLYLSSSDLSGTNKYTKEDFSNNTIWGIFQVDSVMNIPSTLNKSAFAKITVFGKSQLTYKGWPLYYYGNDKQKMGNNKGVSIKTPSAWSYLNINTGIAPTAE